MLISYAYLDHLWPDLVLNTNQWQQTTGSWTSGGSTWSSFIASQVVVLFCLEQKQLQLWIWRRCITTDCDTRMESNCVLLHHWCRRLADKARKFSQRKISAVLLKQMLKPSVFPVKIWYRWNFCSFRLFLRFKCKIKKFKNFHTSFSCDPLFEVSKFR